MTKAGEDDILTVGGVATYDGNEIVYEYQNEIERIFKQNASLVIHYPNGEKKVVWTN